MLIQWLNHIILFAYHPLLNPPPHHHVHLECFLSHWLCCKSSQECSSAILPWVTCTLLEAGWSLVSCEQLRYKGEICCGHPMIVDHNTCVFSVVSEVDCCYSILLTRPHLCCWTLPIPLISFVIYSWKRFPIVSFFFCVLQCSFDSPVDVNRNISSWISAPKNSLLNQGSCFKNTYLCQ